MKRTACVFLLLALQSAVSADGYILRVEEVQINIETELDWKVIPQEVVMASIEIDVTLGHKFLRKTVQEGRTLEVEGKIVETPDGFRADLLSIKYIDQEGGIKQTLTPSKRKLMLGKHTCNTVFFYEKSSNAIHEKVVQFIFIGFYSSETTQQDRDQQSMQQRHKSITRNLQEHLKRLTDKKLAAEGLFKVAKEYLTDPQKNNLAEHLLHLIMNKYKGTDSTKEAKILLQSLQNKQEIDDDACATVILKVAKEYLADEDKIGAGKVLLKLIIKEYKDTETAKEAQFILKRIQEEKAKPKTLPIA